MKKLILTLSIILFVSVTSFSQENDIPIVMTEVCAGYAVGVDLNNAGFFDIKFIYPYKGFGFTLEGGGMFAKDEKLIHAFIGPMLLINIQKLRIPISIGGDIIWGKSTYLGIGGIVALHYSFNKSLYAGVNFEVTYVMNIRYEEIVGSKTEPKIEDDGAGNPIVKYYTVPIKEMKNHYGKNWYFKPSIIIGYQYY